MQQVGHVLCATAIISYKQTIINPLHIALTWLNHIINKVKFTFVFAILAS